MNRQQKTILHVLLAMVLGGAVDAAYDAFTSQKAGSLGHYAVIGGAVGLAKFLRSPYFQDSEQPPKPQDPPADT